MSTLCVDHTFVHDWAFLGCRSLPCFTTSLSAAQALSNQKLFETRKRFGNARCGLQTGDASLNTEADIVIMTTEILRNIMYRTAEGTADDGSSTGESCGLCPGYLQVRSGSAQTVCSVAAAKMDLGLLSVPVSHILLR